MQHDRFTSKNATIENIFEYLVKDQIVTVPQGIAIVAAVVAIANNRAIDGTRWERECQTLCNMI